MIHGAGDSYEGGSAECGGILWTIGCGTLDGDTTVLLLFIFNESEGKVQCDVGPL